MLLLLLLGFLLLLLLLLRILIFFDLWDERGGCAELEGEQLLVVVQPDRVVDRTSYSLVDRDLPEVSSVKHRWYRNTSQLKIVPLIVDEGTLNHARDDERGVEEWEIVKALYLHRI